MHWLADRDSAENDLRHHWLPQRPPWHSLLYSMSPTRADVGQTPAQPVQECNPQSETDCSSHNMPVSRPMQTCPVSGLVSQHPCESTSASIHVHVLPSFPVANVSLWLSCSNARPTLACGSTKIHWHILSQDQHRPPAEALPMTTTSPQTLQTARAHRPDRAGPFGTASLHQRSEGRQSDPPGHWSMSPCPCQLGN